MRKNFLLVFLLAVLPLMGWAADQKPVGAVNAETGLIFKTGAVKQVLMKAATAPDNYGPYDTSVGKVYYLVKDNATEPIKTNPNWKGPYKVNEVPTAITGDKAGTYYVFYYFTNDGTVNYNVDGDVAYTTVAIGKKTAVAGTDFTAPTAATGLEYDGTPKALLNVEAPAGGHFVYQVRQRNLQNNGWVAGWPSSSTWQTELPKGTNGTGYVVRYRYVNDDDNYVTWANTNYVTIPSSGYINIEKVTPTVTPPEANELEYTGSPQTLLKTAAVADYGNVQYRITNAPLIGGGGTWGPGDFASIPQRTAAGNYTIQYRVSPGGTTSPGYNWNATGWESITVTIANAEPTITTAGVLEDDYTYTGVAKSLIKTPVAVNTGNIRYYINKDGAGDGAAITNPAQVTGLDAGEYEVSYDVDVTGISLLNYKDAGKKSLGKVKIEKAKLTIANVGYTKDFDNTEFGVTTENVIKFVDGIGWVGTEGSDEDLKAEVLGKLIKHVSGLPKINVGGYKVLLESQDDPTVNYTVDPLFHAEADLNILKIDNTWKNDVSIATTWPYGSAPAKPSAEPNLTKKENGEDAEITFKYYTDAACTSEFTGKIDETMPVGTYYVKAFVEGCNNFFPLESVAAASFEITATSPTWTKNVVMAGWEYTKYNATTNAPSAEAIDDATITFKYYEDAACTTEIAAEDVPTLGVGKYYVKAFAAATANHTADVNGPAEFEVTATVLPATGIADVTSPYDATNQNPGADAINAAILAKTGLVAGTDYELSFDPSDQFINVGDYYVIATGKGNYAQEIDGEINTQKVKFTITQADVPLDDIIAAKAELLTYDNTDQVLAKPASIKAGSILVGNFEYSLTGEDGSWTSDMPTGFNAGDYTVYTKFTPSTNFKDNVEVTSIPAKIEQAQLKITLTNTFEKPWDGLEIDDITETYVIDGLQGDDAYVVPFTLSLPVTAENNFIDAKVYELKSLDIAWKDEDVKNYKIAFVTVGSITINKVDIDPAADFEAPALPSEDLVYNGDPEGQALVTPGKMINDYGTILYYQGETAPAEDAADWSEDVPVGINAGDYPVWYMVKGDDNHNNYVAPAALAGKILPKPWDAVIAFETAEVIYNGKDFMPKDLSIKDGEDAENPLKIDGEKPDYTLSITNGAGDEVTELIDVDTYTFTYTGINNYDGSTATATITINPAELNKDMLSEYSESLKYDMTDQNPNITLTYEGMTLVAGTDFEAAVPTEMINADTYEWTYTGIGNYTGTVPVKIVINKLPAQAVAESTGKVYDGIAGLSGTEIKFTYTGLLKGEPEDAIAFADGVVTNAKDFLNVGTYVMEFDPTAFSSKNYDVKGVEKNGATFTVTPATLTVAWNAEATPFSKVYGDEDTEFAGSEDNLVIVGAVDAELAQIIADTQFSRVDGDDEAVGPHDLQLGKKMYKDAYGNPYPAPIFDNYEVSFGLAAGALVIGEAEIYVSIAPQTKKYDGEAVADWTATEEQLVITDWKGNDLKADVFQEMPTATVTASEAQVGEYELTLKPGKAHDYKISYLPSTFTIEPKPIKVTFTPQQVQVGEVVEDAIDSEAFAIEGLVDEADAALFAVDVDGDLQDFDGVITGAPGTYEKGLVLISLDDELTANYTGWETAGGELLIIAGETIVLNDAEEGKFTEKKGVNVTFESRSINAGTWNVCALPFATTPAQISNAFGYAAVDILNEEGNGTDVHFKVISSGPEDGKIPAYWPFLVKTTEDKDLVKTNFNQVTFYDVDIEAGNGKNYARSDAAGNKFIGTFEKETTFTGGEYLYMSKGDWYDASKRSVTLKPFRAYVQLVNPKARIFIEEPDGTVTAIDAVRFNEEINAEGMFNLNGVKVNNINRKGVYIKNGVKVIK